MADHGNGDERRAAARRPLGYTPAGGLSADTAQTAGMARAEAISGRICGSEALWMGETRMAPSARSADHHHGPSETGIYVVAGHPEFVFASDREEVRIATSPGDFVHVPPWVPHREENPSPDTEAVVVIARSTQEAIAVTLADLWAGGADPQASLP